jgi:hypothetical protein
VQLYFSYIVYSGIFFDAVATNGAFLLAQGVPFFLFVFSGFFFALFATLLGAQYYFFKGGYFFWGTQTQLSSKKDN